MKIPNWLYFALVISAMAGLTRLLTYLLLLLLFYPFRSIAFLNLELDLVLILLAPYFISLWAAYALVSRRIPNPSERRLPFSIVVTLIGAIMFLSGTIGLFSGTGFYNFFDPAFEILNVLIGFGVMLVGFSLALPYKTTVGLLSDVPAQPERSDPSRERIRGYLPAAGGATLIATILTAVVTFFAIRTALSPCYSSVATCVSTSLISIVVLSSVGAATGIVATYTLLMGRYRRTVPLALIFITLSSLFIFVWWEDLFLLAIPIFAMSLTSTVLLVLNQGYAFDQGYSIKTSDRKTISIDWKVVCILSACLGTIALVAGILQFIPGTWNVCQGVFVHTYLNNAGLLLGLGATGSIIALMSAASAHASRGKPGFQLTKQAKVKRSWYLKVLIILLTISLVSTTVFAGALVAPYFTQCRDTFCYTQVEQLNVLQATPVPSSNQATFTLANSGTSDITVIEVVVQGGAISNPTPASQLSVSMVCKGNSTLLVATFPGVTFVKGTSYTFQLTSSKGDSFPFSIIA